MTDYERYPGAFGDILGGQTPTPIGAEPCPNCGGSGEGRLQDDYCLRCGGSGQMVPVERTPWRCPDHPNRLACIRRGCRWFYEQERTISLDDLKRKYGEDREHGGCSYRAVLIEHEDGPWYFCNKCGWGEEAPTFADGTVRLPAAVEAWLDGHFAGEKDDDPAELEAARNIVAVALWSLMYHQGDPEDDQACLDALVNRGVAEAENMVALVRFARSLGLESSLTKRADDV